MRKFFHGIWRSLLLLSTLVPLYLSYLWLWLREEKLGMNVPAKAWENNHRKQARRFYRLAVRMRGGMIKVGQLISVRVDLMPKPWIEELSKLQDQVEPHPWPIIEAHLLSEYGRPLEECFRSIEKGAAAAASFGQVHRAVTHDGQELALKVRYPDIVMKLDVDLALFSAAVPLFNVFVPKVKLKSIYREMRTALENELNYRQEAEYTRTIHDNMAGLEHTVVPEVFDEFTTDRVIATSYFKGHRITDKATMARHALEPVTLLRLVVNAWCKMMYMDGIFQSDPHPGNILFRVDEDGQPTICILDFGQVKVMPKDFQDKLLRSVLAFLSKDPEQYQQSMVNMGLVTEADGAKMKPLIEKFFEKYYHLTPAEAKQLDFNKIREDVRGLIKQLDGVTIPQDLVLYGRTFSLLAGLSTAMDEDVNGFELAKPIILNWMAVSAAQSTAVSTPA